MSQSPITVSYSLEEVLSRIEGKIDGLVKDVTDLKVGQVEIRGDVKALDERLSGQIKALDERLSGQIKALDERLSGQIESLDERLSGQITVVNSRLNTVETSTQKIPDLAEKVGELKNWRQIAVITVTAFISGVVTWVIRGGNPKL